MFAEKLRYIAVSTTIVFIGGCASYHIQQLDFHRSLLLHQPERALELLDAQRTKRRDKVLYRLNKGMLLHYLGDYHQSNRFLESAKNRIRKLEAVSVLENVGAISLNETLRSYAGQPHEKMMLYVYKAMNYLALAEVSAARVEILQADIQINEWISANQQHAIASCAFVRYLAGMVFEANNEMDEALIAYRKSYEIYKLRGWAIPRTLQGDLLRLSRHLQLDDEYRFYQEIFRVDTHVGEFKPNAQGELIYILNNSLIIPLEEHVMAIFNEDMQEDIFVALPYYPPVGLNMNHELPYNPVYINERSVFPEFFENLEWLARENLEERMPGLVARAIARVVVKQKAVDEANEESKLLGFITKAAANVSEQADTRSWSTLPASIAVARVFLQPGVYYIGGSHGAKSKSVKINAGAKTFLFEHTVAGDGEMTRH